jgi:hypothetical protein
MTRTLVCRVLVVAACVVTTLALFAGYVRRAGVDSDQFANRATAALRDDSVRSLVATEITDRLVLRNQADLIAARPLIQSAAAGAVGSSAFTGLFRAGVRDLHAALFNREQSTVTLAVADVGTVLAAALDRLAPDVASKVDSSKKVVIVRRDVGSLAATTAHVADRVKLLALVLAILALGLIASAIYFAPDRRQAVVQLGTGLAISGVVVLLAYEVVRSIAVNHVEGAENRAAAAAVWDAFMGDLHGAAWILAGSGAVVAAAAASYLKPVDIRVPLRRAGTWIGTEPQRPALRVLRAFALIAVGLVVAFNADAVVHLLVTVLGVYLIYAGVAGVLRVTYDPDASQAARPARQSRRRLLAPLLAVVLIAAALGAFAAGGGTSAAAPARPGCNGHVELCSRTLPEIALPATHNAMSVPLPGWYSSEQDRPIADQLHDGVRGLLIDTHYADRLGNGKLRTVLDDPSNTKVDGVSPEAVAAAKRTRERLGFSGTGKRDMYLCHTFCELGGTLLSETLRDLHAFVVANPSDVFVVINQDYVTPSDFVGAVRTAGLEKFAYAGPVSGRWPTLRQMIDSGQRVLFMAENRAGAAPWYRPVYDSITEETPYTFSKVAQLTDPASLASSCRANRGPARAPILLVNHWISTDPIPLPSDAEKVNGYGQLLKRARECQRVRHHFPNLVAVNFYRRGDLFRVVDALNGVRHVTRTG